MRAKKIIFTLVVGGIGGVLIGNFILPFLAERSPFGLTSFFNIFVRPQVETVIKETKITIEPDFWRALVPQAEKSVAVVQYFSSSRALISQSNGIILTNDGIIVVPLNAVPKDFSVIQVFENDKIVSGTLLASDAVNNLALIKIESLNLPILAYSDLSNLTLGQSVLLVGKRIDISKPETYIYDSLISEIDGQVLFLDLEKGQKRWPLSGTLAIDSNGKMAGMVQISNLGHVFVMPYGFLKNILDDYLADRT